ncbi:DUF2795 domain-containing protein [Salinisphaera japonica]|uniref:DUF2795 domain-containing protein n=1 Tax=Salinisphaera japonica YTM-1 TaxID=1209778 RepID=A0A423Q2S5_9GAMM|nr:DUF2795 domain-containing protein [Salinisphaera japonica]ROO32853.1 hypothetical protein SAJA_01090 [Salinisphaera japonica YTM-1]
MAENEFMSNPAHASAAKIQEHLAGVAYPATKQTLQDYATNNDAPLDVRHTLEIIADEEYEGPADVSRAVGAVV